MPNYFVPRVFVQPSNYRRSISGVATSTTAMVGQTERGSSKPQLVQNTEDFRQYFGDAHDAGSSFLPYAVQGFFDNGGKRLYIARIAHSDASTATADYSTANPAQKLVVSAIGPGAWGSRLYLRIASATRVNAAGQDPRIRITVLYFRQSPVTFVDPLNAANTANPNWVEPQFIEDFDNLGLDPAAPDYALTQLGASRLIQAQWANPAAPPSLPGNQAFGQLTRVNGSDGSAPLTALEYQGSTSRNTGLAGLEGIDEIGLITVPDEVHPDIAPASQGAIRNAVVLQCERLRNRFAILQLAGQQPASTVAAPGLDSAYAAIYYPWIRVFNPPSGDTILIPPGGHIAGIYARCDAERGVHKAPANMLLKGILDQPGEPGRSALEYTVTSQQQQPLNAQAINIIRDFRERGRGVRVWGARTLSSDARWRYISVRRLSIFIEASVHKHLQWVAFAVNDIATRTQIQQEVSAFLNTLFVSGALQGSKSSEAYFVRCYALPQPRNILCELGIAATRPAEFEIIRIQQATAS